MQAGWPVASALVTCSGAAAVGDGGVAAAGAVGGAVGGAGGAGIGGVVGGRGGKEVGEAIDPTREDSYWKDNYKSESYYDASYNYEDYSPAYRAGYTGRARLGDRSFDDVETDLRTDYERSKGSSKLSWDHAKIATRAAWDRLGIDRR